MKYIDYVQLNPFQKLSKGLKDFFVNLPSNLAKFFKLVVAKIVAFFTAVVMGVKNYCVTFVKGGWSTKLSYVIMGAGCMAKGQVIKGILFLAIQVGYIYYMISFGWPGNLSKFTTLGTQGAEYGFDANGLRTIIFHDNSMTILLYSVMAIMISVAFFALYITNIKIAKNCEDLKKSGKKPLTVGQDIKRLLDENYHKTLLTLPVIMVGTFTILPLIFMILIAFTNYDANHQVPANLFTWVGFHNFTDVFFDSPIKSYTFQNLVGWTLIWAVVATFSNYILGIIFSLMINKKSIKLKSVFRTMFVLAIAVPQFVSLLLMAQMLEIDGVINVILRDWGVVEQLQNFGLVNQNIDYIPFMRDEYWAKFTVIFVNMWIGIPFTILITSGILMNIPQELYESARIDGASPVVTFFKITMPYMLFVTTPYLIQQFIGNINNFNVIFFLTGGGPPNGEFYNAGHTDILVTWLFKLTTERNDYSLAATIGILVFILSAFISLVTFNLSKSSRNEEEFS